MAAELETNRTSWGDWIADNTEFHAITHRLAEAPETSLRAWLRTTAGVVAFLMALQIVTGILLAFHYVPAADSAYTTVAYVEQVVSGGSWIRSLHYHTSVALPIAFVAHLAQFIIRDSFRTNRIAWSFGVIFLGLALAAGATGYALPWDARSLNGVNVAVSLAGNAPVVGPAFASWLRNGDAISTMTLSRFFALHVFVFPALFLIAAAARLFFVGNAKGADNTRHSREWRREQLIRNAVVIGVIFAVLGFFSAVTYAPLAVPATDSASFLPRPGPQFLWLFEMQKYTDGPLAALLAFGLPGLFFGSLIVIPQILGNRVTTRLAVAAIFVAGLLTVASLTAAAYLQDANDPKIAGQLARQEKDETEFRASVFKPKLIKTGKADRQPETQAAVVSDSNATSPASVPEAYVSNCAKCHGAGGEGKRPFPELHGLTTRDEERRSDDDLLGIINDPGSFGLSSKMPSYEHKLTDEQKQEIINWLKALN